MSPNERQVLDALVALTDEYGPPSQRRIARWIGDHHGRSPNVSTVWAGLEQLRREGIVECRNGKYLVTRT